MAPEVAAVLLAAGASTRMGTAKQLLALRGKPAIRFCVEAMQAGGLHHPVVVLGSRREECEAALAELSVTFAVNDDPKSEMAESVRIGLRSAAAAATGILICLCDHPLVAPSTYKEVSTAHLYCAEQIIIPVYKGRRGHPTLFPRSLLEGVYAGLTMRDVIQRNHDRVTHVALDDEGILLDMDTVHDYTRLCARAESWVDDEKGRNEACLRS